MGRPKLSPEESSRRKLISKQKKSKAQKSKRAAKRAIEKTPEEIKQMRLKHSTYQKKYRSDPINHQRELVLQRRRRALKRKNEMENLCSMDDTPPTEIAIVVSEPVLKYDINEIYSGPVDSVKRVKNGYCTDSEFKKLFEMCNPEQLTLVEHCKSLLVNEPTHRLHWFIQGAAGTGKSFLINIIHQMMMRLFQHVDSVMLVAPTARAAFHIKGETIHHALGINLNEQTHLTAKRIANYKEKYSKTKCIMIDEISMVGANMYDMMDARLKVFKGNDEPFGGLHVLHFGDLNQLPPVNDVPIFKRNLDTWRDIQYFELNESMRQHADRPFAQLLNRLAKGQLTRQDVQCLKGKETSLENVPPTATCLFFCNRHVAWANRKRLESIEGELVECRAYDIVLETVAENVRCNALKKVRRLRKQLTANLEPVIWFKVGAKYMLTYNLDQSDGLVNGAVGILKRIEYCPGHSESIQVKRIWLQFPNGIGDQKQRRVVDYALSQGMELNWTPVDRIDIVLHRVSGDDVAVSRNQFSVIVAEAITIHKSQGSTFQQVAVGFDKSLNQSLQYVALSRVTSSQGLYIVGRYETPKPLRNKNLILKEMKRLKERAITPRRINLQSRIKIRCMEERNIKRCIGAMSHAHRRRKAREQKRKQRQHIYNDPEKHEMLKRKEREYYQKRKREGRLKTIRVKTPQEQMLQRKKWNKYMKKYRARKAQKMQENPPSGSDESKFSSKNKPSLSKPDSTGKKSLPKDEQRPTTISSLLSNIPTAFTNENESGCTVM